MKQGRDPAILYQDEMRVICRMNQRNYDVREVGNLSAMKAGIVTSPFFRARAAHLRKRDQMARIYLPFQCVWDLRRARTDGETLIAAQRFNQHLQYGFRVIPKDEWVVQRDGDNGVLVNWRLVMSAAERIDDGDDNVDMMEGLFSFNE